MFKFLDSGAADEEIAEGLVSHLNDEEFLSDFGLHSMSKLDEAYDQVDIEDLTEAFSSNMPFEDA